MCLYVSILILCKNGYANNKDLIKPYLTLPSIEVRDLLIPISIIVAKLQIHLKYRPMISTVSPIPDLHKFVPDYTNLYKSV